MRTSIRAASAIQQPLLASAMLLILGCAAPVMGSADPFVRQSIAHLAGRMGEKGMSLLVTAAKDRSAGVRSMAARDRLGLAPAQDIS